ncbi:Nitrogen assimilation transcription factor nirA [Madurella mycetomatis]|uniref:Nitrogen assimilation transcription factor nirA n=1 Tax=Madurella mycetomatis TaxID=100816 RepID=A0A175WHY3_9PEZI|nr:Nitrogen assimilation transcription factor nirA [Madurella mycetomatis]KXX82504.1 Nitrogen assimilation transcription factor nirA [Madurella mycetomatis]
MQNQDGASSVPKGPRRILPAAGAQTARPPGAPGVPGFPGAPGVPSKWTLPPRKKAYSTAACEACRKRKAKVRDYLITLLVPLALRRLASNFPSPEWDANSLQCDAARPSCGYCVSAGVNCAYSTGSERETHAQALKRKLTELSEREATYQQIFDHLRSRTEAESSEIVKRIRSGGDPESILRYIKDADLLLQLAVVPETRYRYVFPLMQDMPAFLIRPDNPYLSTQVYEWTTSSASTTQDLLLSDGSRSLEPQSPYLKPYHAAEIVEPLLSAAKPSDWTKVSSDDTLMRKLFSLYFSCEYQWMPAFQKDYFLQDMAAGHRGCCSSLLVNAVLALASMDHDRIPNRYEYWNHRNLSYQFLAEAERLWDIETASRRVRVTTLQAALILHIVHNVHAMDAIGYSYLRQAVNMAKKIGFFSPESGARRDNKRARAREFTAWSIFNCQGIYSYVTFQPPLLRTPPDIPLPDPSVDPDWYGQIWLKYPLDAKLFSTNFPHMFWAHVGILTIINDICVHRFGAFGSAMPALGVAKANEFYCRLRNWYDNLPGPLKPEKIALPAHLMLHMNYQNIVVNLWEPICATEQARVPQGDGTSPWEIWNTASRHFETLTRLYYLRHGFDYGDTFLGHPLNQLAFISLNKILAAANANTPSNTFDLDAARSTLILAAKGLHDQGKSHFLSRVALEMLKIQMGPVERDMLGKVIGEVEEDTTKKLQELQIIRGVKSKFVPSAVSIADDPEVHRLGYLVSRYMRLEDGQGEGDDEVSWRGSSPGSGSSPGPSEM